MKYAIATSRDWNTFMAEELNRFFQGEHEFILIDSKEKLTPELLSVHNPAMIFFPHWSYIIPQHIYSNYECVIFHMADLPYGRGGSPLQNLIIRGHKTTKISALKCSRGVDTGPIYLKKDLSLDGSAREIFGRASGIILNMIQQIIQEDPVPAPQKGKGSSFPRRTPEQSDIAALSEIEHVFDYIRMLDADGYPKAFFETESFRFEFENAVIKNGEVRANVTIKKL